MSEIIIKNAIKKYGNNTVIQGLNLRVKDGELFTLLGPSGCGKTTLLRMIAGFNSIEGGDFFFNDKRINDVDPSKRNIGMVFQNYAIFPHLTVFDNVAFGLRQRKQYNKQSIIDQTNEYLKLMQIDQYTSRKPHNLSGGQQQRVALARALVIKPDVLLMDEPLSNLDAKLRVEMRQVIRHIQKSIGITTVYVTHDQEEAMAISDCIAVMNKGVIQQVGHPKQLYHRPSNEFVATFIGRTNILSAKANNNVITLNNNYQFKLNKIKNLNGLVRVSIRPEEFVITKNDTGLTATIEDSVYLGLNTEYYLKLASGESIQVIEESSFNDNYNVGDLVNLEIKLDKINVFNEDGSVNLVNDNV